MLDILFHKGGRKLTAIEEELFIKILKQSHIIQSKYVIDILNKKLYFLSNDARLRIKSEILSLDLVNK